MDYLKVQDVIITAVSALSLLEVWIRKCLDWEIFLLSRLFFMKHNNVTFRIMALQKILSIQNSTLDIRISALDSDFSSLAEQTMLMLGGGGDSVRDIL